ncbi:MAG: glycoside hydrolase family 57 protein [Anaerolineae bacterium]
MKGAFTFVLHSHLPYVRKAGRWPHGEEMLHEAIAETYIPLLNALFELKQEGYTPRLTIGLTPILLEQLSDPDVLAHFELYLLEKLALVEADIQRHREKGDAHLLYLAEFYLNWYQNILESFTERYKRNLVAAFRQLQDEGNLDILTSAATHGYLPLMERDSTIYAQLKVGLETTRRHLGRAPRGIWLPECGYRPAFVQDGTYKPGLEEFLSELNLGYFFTDTHVIVGGKLVGKVAGDAIGPYGALPKRKLVVRGDERPEAKERTTMRPYYVHSANVAVYGRDERTGLQVWSTAHGYPGDFLYREFHRKDDHSGLQYWRITGAQVDLGQKDLYDPQAAMNQVHLHADHFVHILEEEVTRYYAATGKPGIVVSAYDTELFGHWWFEGVTWLKEVLRRLGKNDTVALMTAGDYLEAYPPDEVIALPESSWGQGGGHWTWLNPDTEWMWPLIHNAEWRMEELVARYPQAEGELREVLNQAARELLLLESSDWPFLISTGQAREYASGRFQQHLARFHHLASIAESGAFTEMNKHFLSNTADLDNPFPDIDYRVFARREKPAD